jgi:signal transduction histidine kinase
LPSGGSVSVTGLFRWGCVRSVWRLIWLGLGLALWLPAVAQGPAKGPVLQWEQQDAAGRWQAVSLPLRWGVGLPGQPRELRLRSRFVLDAEADQPWGLSANRLPPDRQILLNGLWLQGREPGSPLALRQYSLLPQWVDVPPALLRRGANTLELRLEVSHRAGELSPVQLGPATPLRTAYGRLLWWTVSLPQALNLASSGLSLFMLMVWCFRRSEVMLGFFGALWLLLSLRNLAYYMLGSPLSPSWGEFGFFMGQVSGAVLGLGFASAMAGRPLPWRGRLIPLVWVVGAVVGGVAAAVDAISVARLLFYPVLLGLLLWVGWLLCQVSQDGPWRSRWAALAFFSPMLVAAVHDYLHVSGGLPLRSGSQTLDLALATYWIPFATPVMLLSIARWLLLRFVRALDAAEQQGHLLERQVAARTLDLAAANAAKSRFVAAASHDLRQPVASIGLLAGLLRDQVSAAGAQVLGRLTESVQALESLLKGLLDLSRFDAGSVLVQPRVLGLQALFDAVLTHEREAAALKGLRLRCRGGQLAVRADPVLLEQALRNLVANAVQYTARGGVLLAARRRGSTVLIQVWDTGCGIALEQQAQVFEEYVQLDNPARERHRGLGLGLSLVLRAAQHMAAPLSVRSQPGQGSCFGLVLPWAPALAGPAPSPVSAPVSLNWAGRRVLLVDDDAGVREAMRLQLQHWGMVVSACANLAQVRQCLDPVDGMPAFDLLISDQRLPDGSAADVLALLHARQPKVPALVITGDTSPEDLARLEASGLDILHKPFSAAALWASLPTLSA